MNIEEIITKSVEFETLTADQALEAKAFMDAMNDQKGDE